MIPDEKRLEEIEGREKEARPGPWYNDKGKIRTPGGPIVANVGPVSWQGLKGYQPEIVMNTSDFIAHAREDVPWLIAKVRELEKENDELRDVDLQNFLPHEQSRCRNDPRKETP